MSFEKSIASCVSRVPQWYIDGNDFDGLTCPP